MLSTVHEYYLEAYPYIFIAVLIYIVIFFILGFLTPKNLLEKYFQQPYFNELELVIFSNFPYKYFRVAIFMRLVIDPKSGKKRGIYIDTGKECPTWFLWVSRIVLPSFLISFIICFVPMLILPTKLVD